MSEGWVLVVEDDGDVREVFSMVLSEEGYHVVTAPNGLEALEQVEVRGAPALMLLDASMPVMSGEDLLHAIEANGMGEVPVVLLSGDPDAAEIARRFPSVCYLPKPIGVDELLRAVGRFARPSVIEPLEQGRRGVHHARQQPPSELLS